MAKEIEFQIGAVKTTAHIAVPEGAPRGGVVYTFHREGLDEFTDHQLDQLAQAGFLAIAPNHYHVLPAGVGFEDRKDYIQDEVMAHDLEVAARWLVDQGVNAGRIAVMGPCMGGRTTLVALTATPTVWACGCIWYGGSSYHPTKGSSWPAPADPERLKRITAPIAGFFGNDDKNPSKADIDELDARLSALGKPHVFHRYDGVGHAFQNPHNEKAWRPDASSDSWTKAMDFIAKQFGV